MYRLSFIRVLLLLGLLLAPAAVSAQITKVRGQVTDAETGEPVAYAAVFFDGTSIGVSTDENGRYYIETRAPEAVRLTAQMLGYLQQTKKVSYGAFSEVNFALDVDASMLAAARILPDDRYVKFILSQVDKCRPWHDPELGEPWSTRIYSKIELDATHAEWIATQSFLRDLLGDVVNYRDTSAVTGESYIPIMISETLSRKYHGADPNQDKEVILANRISGLDPDNFMRQYAGSYLLKTNFYKSTIDLFNLEVPSPAAAYGQAFYNYFLIDSLDMDGRKTYCLRFHPKRGVTSPAFDGELYIDAQDFGIRSAHVQLARGSNVNWIRHINIDTENRKTAEGRWFPKEEKLFVDFSIAVSDSSKVLSFLGNRELHYSEPDNEDIPASVLQNPDAVVMPRVAQMNDDDWKQVRPVPLTNREQGIYSMVDEVKRKPSYKLWYTVARSLIVGYVEGEETKIAYGPWAQTFKYNVTEGPHVGVGFRTTKHFHQKLRLTGKLGYGFRDKKLKGGASVEYVFDREVTRKLTLRGNYDYEQLGQGSAVLTQPSMFNSLLNGHRGDRQTLLRDLQVTYEHEHSPNFTSYIGYESRRLFGNDSVPLFTPRGIHLNSVSINQLHYTARFSWSERINRGYFDKAHIFTRYPVVLLDLYAGLPGVTKDDYGFVRGEVTFDWRIPTGAFGFGSIHFNSGVIFGELPYPFLKLHEGNTTYFLDKTAFTCMDYYEFASDRWCSLMYEHNLNGLILGRIPLINRLDLREIISLKTAIGTLSDANRMGTKVLPLEGMSSLEIPYVEAGVGLSNIFRVVRVDAAWRLTHRRDDFWKNFRITVGFDVQF